MSRVTLEDIGRRDMLETTHRRCIARPGVARTSFTPPPLLCSPTRACAAKSLHRDRRHRSPPYTEHAREKERERSREREEREREKETAGYIDPSRQT